MDNVIALDMDDEPDEVREIVLMKLLRDIIAPLTLLQVLEL